MSGPAISDHNGVEQILIIFRSNPTTKPGKVITTEHIEAFAAAALWDLDEVLQGVELAIRQGWIEVVPPDSYRLTEEGFERI